jgi:protein-S-isoprenylcysteine O-methyltransferase Ste14
VIAGNGVQILQPARRVLQLRTAPSEGVETAKVAVEGTDVVASDAVVVDSGSVPPASEVTSHPLPDLFGAQELISELQDQQHFGKRGEVYTLAQIAAVVLVLLPPFQLTGLVDILATLLITAGVVFMVYSLLSLGRNISPLPAPRQRHELVTTGMYSYIRHPLYAGLLMVAFGLAVVTRNETRLAMAALLWLLLEKKVAVEERMLVERYGKVYEEYKGRVKKFFPFVY